ncbi:hypothetical protein [Bradyrhizobium sp.]|uniref:bestrophin-like domain n=1 Tax=Bradyrhizobium sp. TaxID=376 RepID=UPI003D09ED10
MTSTWIFLVSFFAILAGGATGMTLRVRLPKAHLNAETREMIRLGASLLATLVAVIISLTIASAKSSYETQDAHFRQLAAYLVEVDQLLAQYGPEATAMRQQMREQVPAAIDRIWHEKATASQDTAFTARSLAEQLYTAAAALSPNNDTQRGLKSRVEQAIADIARTRLSMFADGDTPVLTPFMLILIFWLMVVFVSFGLFVEPGPVVFAALLVFALSISTALFLVADLSRPFVGLMQIPKEQLKHTLAPLN